MWCIKSLLKSSLSRFMKKVMKNPIVDTIYANYNPENCMKRIHKKAQEDVIFILKFQFIVLTLRVSFLFEFYY